MRTRSFLAIVLIALITGVAITAASARDNANQKDSLQAAFTREYNLRPKFKKGETRYYRLVIVYNQQNPLLQIVSRNEYRADFQRTVESVRPDGGAWERMTWRNGSTRSAPSATAAFGPPSPLPALDNFSYRFCAEEGHEIGWNLDAFPKTMLGYLSLMQAVDAHYEFDYLRSSRHGAIEKLRHIGDEVDAPDGHTVFTINFPPLVPSSNLVKRDVFVKFLGLTYAGGEICALLGHRQGPGDFSLDFASGPGKTMHDEITSFFDGILVVRVSDGSLVHGDFIERVGSKMPGTTPPSYGYTLAFYNIDEISREEFDRTPARP